MVTAHHRRVDVLAHPLSLSLRATFPKMPGNAAIVSTGSLLAWSTNVRHLVSVCAVVEIQLCSMQLNPLDQLLQQTGGARGGAAEAGEAATAAATAAGRVLGAPDGSAMSAVQGAAGTQGATAVAAAAATTAAADVAADRSSAPSRPAVLMQQPRPKKSSSFAGFFKRSSVKH
jgi:hypothetical protein